MRLSLCPSLRSSGGGAGVAGGAAGFGSVGVHELPCSARSSVPCAAIRVEAGLAAAARRHL